MDREKLFRHLEQRYEAVQRYFQDPEHVKKYEAWKKEKEAESDGGDKT